MSLLIVGVCLWAVRPGRAEVHALEVARSALVHDVIVGPESRRARAGQACGHVALAQLPASGGEAQELFSDWVALVTPVGRKTSL